MTHSPTGPVIPLADYANTALPGVHVRRDSQERGFWELTNSISVGTVTLRNGHLGGYRETPAFHGEPLHMVPTHKARGLLTGVVFAVDLRSQDPSSTSSTQYHVYRKCPRSIEPLLGAPAIPWNLAKELRVTPLSKDTSYDIVVGATLSSPTASEPGVVVHLDPSGQAAWVKLPSKPFPVYGAIGDSNAFTTPSVFLPYDTMLVWHRKVETPVSYDFNFTGNCPTLRPGDMTSRGRVLWVGTNSVRFYAYGVTADVQYIQTGYGAAYINVAASGSPTVTLSTAALGFDATPKFGELWETLLGLRIAITGDEAGVVIPHLGTHSQAEILDFWNSQHQGTVISVPVSCSEHSGHHYPRSMDPKHLLVAKVANAGSWCLTSNMDRPVGMALNAPGATITTVNWRSLPLDPWMFRGGASTPYTCPALHGQDLTQTTYTAPVPEDSECEEDDTTVTCDVCGDEEGLANDAISLRLFSNSNRSQHATACLSCQNESTICPDCNRRYIRRDSNYEVDNGAVCPSCVVAVESAIPTLYRGYSYRPEPKFLGAGPLYFGVELELWTDSELSMKRMAMVVHEKANPVIYSKTDSSIGDHGLEFVTHPFTLDSVAAEEALQTLFTLVSLPNWKARDTCGIHIHTSKLGYKILESSLPSDRTGYLTDAQLLTRGLFRAQKFVYGNPRLITYFAGRDSDRYASLDIQPGEDQERRGDDGYTGFEDALRLCREHRADKPNRYAAMNFTTHTVEYRVFKSTKDYAELLRDLHFIESIVQYARHHAMPKTRAPSLKPYREFLETQASWDDVRKFFDAGLGTKFN